ncbi:MAG: cyclic nucleotide-binding domain-containing protein [Pseudomonadota bacterium]
MTSINPEVVILAGGALNAGAYLILNQVLLRVVILISSCFYILYYMIISDTPLRTAIAFTVLTILANLIGLAALLLRDSEARVPRDFADLRALMPKMPAGEFRRLVQLGVRREITQPEILTEANAPVNNLYYLISGELRVTDDAEERIENRPGFVAEVAYLTLARPSATVTALPGTEIMAWDRATLKGTAKRHQRFNLALDALISSDLAQKQFRNRAG